MKQRSETAYKLHPLATLSAKSTVELQLTFIVFEKPRMKILILFLFFLFFFLFSLINLTEKLKNSVFANIPRI